MPANRKKPAPKKRGRPPKPETDRRAAVIKIPVTEAEHERVRQAAGDRSVAEYVRELLGIA